MPARDADAAGVCGGDRDRCAASARVGRCRRRRARTALPDPALPAPEAALSNGWAIGKDRSDTGRGMLLANPHYPWVGSNRFWEKHLTIPGALDVYGVGLLGVPGVQIGFNRDVAWTHTVSAGARYTGYALTLVPGHRRPTCTTASHARWRRARYRRRGQPAGRLTAGLVRARSTSSHHGPIVNFPGLPWTTTRAVALRDANADNDEGCSAWLAIGRATSLDELRRAHGRPGGIPFVNTMAASVDGRAPLHRRGFGAPSFTGDHRDLEGPRRVRRRHQGRLRARAHPARRQRRPIRVAARRARRATPGSSPRSWSRSSSAPTTSSTPTTATGSATRTRRSPATPRRTGARTPRARSGPA